MSSIQTRTLFASAANKESLLTAEQLFDYFARVEYLIEDMVEVLTPVTPRITATILEMGSEIAAKLTRNKTLFRRRVEYHEDTLRDADVDIGTETDAFLCESMTLGYKFSRNQDVTRDVQDTRLTRLFRERILRAWLLDAELYVTASWKAADLYMTEGLSPAYFEAATQASMHLTTIGLQECDTAHGIIGYIRQRIRAIDEIYARITRAYVRVVLKAARAHAMDDDHFLELCQYGVFGLSRANTTYDHLLQARYVAVARSWVRQSVLYHMKASSGVISISPSLWQQRAKMEQVRYHLAASHRDVTCDDIAKHAGYTSKYVESVYSHVRTAQVATYEAITTQDAIDCDMDTGYDLNIAISALTPTQRVYMSLLYGMPNLVNIHLDSDMLAEEKWRQTVAMRLTSDAA